MRRKIIVIAIVIAVITAAVLAAFLWKGEETGDLVLSGNIEVTEVQAGFKTGGRVEKLFTDEGMRVRLGDRLASLDMDELEAQQAQAKASLSEAAARLDELRTGSRPQEIAQAEASLKAAEAELLRTRKDFDRAERLVKDGAMSAQQLDLARSNYETRSEQHRAARENLDLVREGPRKEAIRAAEQRVRQTGAALRVAEERFRDATLLAPVSGIVLKKNIEQGEVVQPGTPVLTIGDLDNPWVKVYVKETLIGRVKLGQRASVTVDSYPGKVYEGTVGFISSEAEFTPRSIQTREERVKLVFGVKVRVSNPGQDLKPGMPADVRITLQ